MLLVDPLTNIWAKAGVMFRSDTSASAAFAFVAVTPGQGVTFQWRVWTSPDRHYRWKHRRSVGTTSSMCQYQGNGVRLGRIRGTDRELAISAEDRQTHLWLPGNSGAGKSKMLESMICQDIDAWGDSGLGLMLIDPHGSVYRNVLKYVVESGLDRPIIPVDFSRDDWILGYNPLQHREGSDPSVIVRAMVLAMAHVFGQQDTQATPRFSRVAATVLHTILLQGRPLLEAAQLVSSRSAMSALASSVDEQITSQGLRRAGLMTEKDFLPQRRVRHPERRHDR